MRKIVFFDIDGTLVDFSGKIPESTIAALKEARRNGHKTYICTGRSRSQIPEKLRILEFDGYVAAAGAYVECEGKEIFHHHMPPEDAQKVWEFCRKENMVYMVQTKESVLMERDSRERFITMLQGRWNRPRSEVEKDISSKEEDTPIAEKMDQIEKFCYHECRYTVDEMRRMLGGHFDVTRMSFDKSDDFSGEITCRGIHKASGMQKVLDYYGAERKDCIAFGDGPNDLEMIEFAGIGVAMGNAVPELKELADDITGAVLGDGIRNAMIKLKLIGDQKGEL